MLGANNKQSQQVAVTHLFRIYPFVMLSFEKKKILINRIALEKMFINSSCRKKNLGKQEVEEADVEEEGKEINEFPNKNIFLL